MLVWVVAGGGLSENRRRDVFARRQKPGQGTQVTPQMYRPRITAIPTTQPTFCMER